MQATSTPEQIAADSQVGYVVAGIGVAISLFFVAIIVFLLSYYETFYSAVR